MIDCFVLSKRPAGRLVVVLPLLASLILVGCGGATPSDGNNNLAADAVGSRSVPCGPKMGEQNQFCLLEVDDRDGTLHLTLRQPDGGFRRLVWPKDGVLAPADGAEALETTRLNGGGVEVRIGGWRYRIEKKGGGLP